VVVASSACNDGIRSPKEALKPTGSELLTTASDLPSGLQTSQEQVEPSSAPACDRSKSVSEAVLFQPKANDSSTLPAPAAAAGGRGVDCITVTVSGVSGRDLLVPSIAS
jgi:hypothetical protein